MTKTRGAKILLLLLFLSIVLECFPISSSGNIYLITKFIETALHISFSKELLMVIDYLSHGAIACTIALYFFPRWIVLVKNLKKTWPIILRLCIAGFVTEIITVFCWLIIDFIPTSPVLLATGFLITTISLWSLRWCPEKSESTIIYGLNNAWLLGFVQGVALLPGISRFGLTFTTARWLGFSSKKSFELSFLISWPINVGAFLLGTFKLYKHQLYDLLNLKLLLVMLIGSGVACCGFYLVEKMIAARRLWVFSIYTLFLSLVVWFT